MTESRHTITYACPGHIPSPDPRWAAKPAAWFVGKWVQKAFCVLDRPGRREHLWVLVAQVTPAGLLVGRLGNKPTQAIGLQRGDPVWLSLDEIEAVLGQQQQEVTP